LRDHNAAEYEEDVDRQVAFLQADGGEKTLGMAQDDEQGRDAANAVQGVEYRLGDGAGG
jgi:hypothetical protein